MADNLRTYNSFSGLDIYAVFHNNIFGELQMVSYKVDREKAPVYTMGSPDLRTIARGKRLVTGACVFVVFDRDSLLATLQGDEILRPALNIAESANLNQNADAIVRAGSSVGLFGELDVSGDAGAIGNQIKATTTAVTADQLLAFDVTMVGVNEYGATTKMVIHGVELMTEASGVSIDDLVIEKQFSFIARRITNWTSGTPVTGSAVDQITAGR